MTKENRKQVTVHGISELQLGDRISFKTTLGEDTRMNTSFTFGGHDSAGYLLNSNGRRVVTINSFLKNIDGWDSTEWAVWRKFQPLPDKGEIIYVYESTRRLTGLYINRGNGSWQGIHTPDYRLTPPDIISWMPVDLVKAL